MARKKLNLNEEERRKYNNEMHRKQSRARREKAEIDGYRFIVNTVVKTFEQLGWDKTELVVGAESEMINVVAEELRKSGQFKITLGTKLGVKIK